MTLHMQCHKPMIKSMEETKICNEQPIQLSAESLTLLTQRQEVRLAKSYLTYVIVYILYFKSAFIYNGINIQLNNVKFKYTIKTI